MMQTRASRWIAMVLAAALLTAPIRADVTTQLNVTYCKVGDRELKLDICRPDGDGPHPAIVFIHGGGWRGGSRNGYRREIVEAARRGYVAVTVTYRLTEPNEEGKATHPFPIAVHDVKCAVRWLRANASTFGVDPNRVGATGGSAGGHLSLMVGLTDKAAGLEGEGGHGDQSSRVQAVVNVFGPTDMAWLHESSKGAAPIVATFLDGSPVDIPKVYEKASPISYVSKGDPPVLSIHGSVDKLVPPDQAQRLDAAMKKVGLTHELLIIEGQGHGFKGDAKQQSREAMYRFFDKHLKAKSGGNK